MENENLKNLIIRIRNGDRDALSELYSAMKTRVYALALVYTKSDSDACDVMQNVFMTVWNRAGTFRGGNPSSWILKITRNAALDCLRMRRHRAELSDEIYAPDCFERISDSETVRNLLSHLKEDERETVLLYSYGYSHAEIASITGRPQATVRWKYSNAVKKLRKLYGGEDNE
ncbi:MAG: RNA polymerase sigma factor [Oscillospiraceae bacterium]|nr:RNA polymerase sigma factor [Oscillospiraceae bacterium]